jgi:hypothetical protein
MGRAELFFLITLALPPTPRITLILPHAHLLTYPPASCLCVSQYFLCVYLRLWLLICRFLDSTVSDQLNAVHKQ